ncbi:MAG: RraA family protein [Lachnospiraceae bacterium]|nr:RraA family protein [Lachnospiraceae bacterium]
MEKEKMSKEMYDVIKVYEKTPEDIVKRYAMLEESASINESIPNKNGALFSGIKAIWPEIRMCGVALTVQCGIGDNIMLHKAISMAGPGDILMVTNGDFDEAGGLFGGMMAASLKARGAAGLVIEGACRDTILIKQLGFPVFSRNICIKATTKVCPGRINHPIVIGGVYVEPGDLVFGDNDSVVVVPRKNAKEVLEIAEKREASEENMLKRILKGETTTFEMFSENYSKLNLREEPDQN